MKKTISFLLMSSICIVGWGQQSFSLAQARQHALEHNYQSKNAAYDVASAQRKIKETIAIGLPQITGKASYNNFIKQPVQLIPAEFFGGNEGEFSEIIFGTKQNASGEIMATQLLFDGSYIIGLQATKAFLTLSKNKQRLSNLEVQEAVTNAYHMVLVAEDNVQLLESSLSKIKSLWRETQAIYDNGFVEESDVDQMAITFKNIENRHHNAGVQVTVARQMLNFQLGINLESTIVLTDNIANLAKTQSDQGFFQSTFDVSQNANYQLANTNLQLKHLQFKNQKAQFLPQLSLFATHQENSFGNDFNFLSNEAKWFPTTMVGVNLNVPIFSSGMKRQQVKQAHIETLKAEQSLKQASQAAELQMLTAKAEYNNALAIYENETQSLRLAEKIKDKTTIKYQEGISSSFELTQAENQYLTTQGQYIQATFNLLSSKNKLDKVLNNY
ncbi:MAG: outer membrane protein [Flavobacteriales bacterium]|jgi:outer membrane protein